jgi:hypothetical protein
MRLLTLTGLLNPALLLPLAGAWDMPFLEIGPNDCFVRPFIRI